LAAADVGIPPRPLKPSEVGLQRTIAPLWDPYGADFSPDGRFLAVACGTEVRLYGTQTWKEVGRLRGAPENLLSAAFSPDGKTLAAGGFQGAVVLWDVGEERLRCTLAGHRAYVAALAFHPDGRRLLSASHDGTARLWDVKEGRELRAVVPGGAVFVAAAFSRDGSRAALAGAGLRVFRTDRWQEEPGPALADQGWLAVGFRPDGRRGWVAGDRSVLVWEAGLTVPAREAASVPEGVGLTAVQLSPDGRFWAAGSQDGALRFFDATGGSPPTVLAHHQGPVRAVALDPRGRGVVTIGRDRHIKVWGRLPAGVARLRPKGFCGIRVDQEASGRVVIVEVIAGTPAEAAGLRRGDVVRKVAGTPVATPTDSVDLIGSFLEGEEVEIEVERGGQAHAVRVRLGRRPAGLEN
jgi:WD40 repeat protein